MQILEKIKQRFDLQKPVALGFREWDKWHKDTRNNRPFAYFIMETVPDKADSIQRLISQPFNDMCYYIRVRLFDRYHIIKTGLAPGYNDCDTRLLHGMFNLIVDFVEVELARKHGPFNDESQKKTKFPWYSIDRLKFKSFRDPQAGLNYLKWEMSLDYPSQHQAAAARELWEIYHWWKFARPLRPDPSDVSGWSTHCDRHRSSSLADLFDITKKTPEEKLAVSAMLAKIRELEDGYEAEDEAYMIRLIKIRKRLWT